MAQQPHLVSVDEIAKLFNVTAETIRLWRKAGMPYRMKSKRPVFEPAACVAWRRERDVEAVIAERGGPDEAREKARRAKLEADLKELDLAERRGQLVSIQIVDALTERIANGFAAAAAGRLSRFERDFVSCSTPAEARIISQEIQVQLMQGGQQLAKELRSEAEAEAEPEEEAAA